MKIHLIIDHPDTNSFNHAIMHAFIEGIDKKIHQIDILDLNAGQFNPVLSKDDLQRYNQGISSDPQIK